MADFDGKVILVTGGATGLGAAIAVGAARRGAKAVIVNCTKSLKEAEATADLVRAAGAEAAIVQGDVADDADCRRIAAAAAPFGRLDALANNAGVTKHVQNHADLDGLSRTLRIVHGALTLHSVASMRSRRHSASRVPLKQSTGQRIDGRWASRSFCGSPAGCRG